LIADFSKFPNPDRGFLKIPKSWSRLEIRYSQRNWKCLAALPCPALPYPYPARQMDGRTDTTTVALIYKINN
jgi:hypothetical protein